MKGNSLLHCVPVFIPLKTSFRSISFKIREFRSCFRMCGSALKPDQTLRKMCICAVHATFSATTSSSLHSWKHDLKPFNVAVFKNEDKILKMFWDVHHWMLSTGPSDWLRFIWCRWKTAYDKRHYTNKGPWTEPAGHHTRSSTLEHRHQTDLDINESAQTWMVLLLRLSSSFHFLMAHFWVETPERVERRSSS